MLLRRRWRNRIYTILILITIIYIGFTYFPAPPEWQNNNRVSHEPPFHETQDTPDFLYFSRFRQNPDLEFEASLEDALVRIEIAAESQQDLPVKKIWQTVKSTEARPDESSIWEEQNPDWDYELLTDESALEFISRNLSGIPMLGKLWSTYPIPVLRADLIRYLLLWYHGGYYSDIDVYPVRSIASCDPLSTLFAIPPKHNISLVVGVEIDEPYTSARTKKLWHWSRTYGFIQYSMYAPKRFSPFLRCAIVRVLAHSRKHAKDTESWFNGPRYSEEDILEVTGPGMFTDALLDVLSETLPAEHDLVVASMGVDTRHREQAEPYSRNESRKAQRVTWAPFHALKNVIWVDGAEPGGLIGGRQDNGGLAVLPINVWGNGQRHSGAEDFQSVHACVNHRFGRTWKKGWWEYLVG